MAGRGAVSAFADHCEWTGANSDNRENWLISRRAGIGGSDVAAIIGVDRRKSAIEVYAEKISNDPPTQEQSHQAAWGRLLEPVVLKHYATISGRRVVRGGHLLRKKDAPHHLITLDGVQLNKAPPGCRGPGVAEVKTTAYAEDYALDEEPSETEDEARARLPIRVQVQMQWEMHVTGAEWATCIWLPLIDRNMQWVDMRADREFQAWLVARVDEFWRRVKRRLPPAPDASKSATDALFKLAPGQTEEVFQLQGAELIANEYASLGDQIKVLEARKRFLRNVLGATMGEARTAVLDDGRYFGAAYYEQKDVSCPHCAGVIGSKGGYRSITLRAPRKKPFVFTGTPRELAVNVGAEEAALTKALTESIVGAAEPSNDPAKETA